MKFDIIESLGAEFGQQLASMFSTVRTVLVEVVSVDAGSSTAEVSIYENTATFPVPCSLFGTEEYGLTVLPTVGTTALITYIDGDLNRPVFVRISEIDKIEFRRSSTNFSLSVDPEDSAKDRIDLQVGNSTASIQSDLIELNGGELKGLVVVGMLTDRLNQLLDEINKIQRAIAGHSHTYIDSVGSAATPTPKTTTATKYSTVSLTEVENSDYENDKITQ